MASKLGAIVASDPSIEQRFNMLADDMLSAEPRGGTGGGVQAGAVVNGAATGCRSGGKLSIAALSASSLRPALEAVVEESGWETDSSASHGGWDELERSCVIMDSNNVQIDCLDITNMLEDGVTPESDDGSSEAGDNEVKMSNEGDHGRAMNSGSERTVPQLLAINSDAVTAAANAEENRRQILFRRELPCASSPLRRCERAPDGGGSRFPAARSVSLLSRSFSPRRESGYGSPITVLDRRQNTSFSSLSTGGFNGNSAVPMREDFLPGNREAFPDNKYSDSDSCQQCSGLQRGFGSSSSLSSSSGSMELSNSYGSSSSGGSSWLGGSSNDLGRDAAGPGSRSLYQSPRRDMRPGSSGTPGGTGEGSAGQVAAGVAAPSSAVRVMVKAGANPAAIEAYFRLKEQRGR